MRNGLALVHDPIQTLVHTVLNAGVVCKTSVDGELLLELYALLECLAPEVGDLSVRLSKVRLVPTRVEPLGLYLVYVPLPDVLTYLVPVSTLPEACELRQ